MTGWSSSKTCPMLVCSFYPGGRGVLPIYSRLTIQGGSTWRENLFTYFFSLQYFNSHCSIHILSGHFETVLLYQLSLSPDKFFLSLPLNPNLTPPKFSLIISYCEILSEQLMAICLIFVCTIFKGRDLQKTPLALFLFNYTNHLCLIYHFLCKAVQLIHCHLRRKIKAT